LPLSRLINSDIILFDSVSYAGREFSTLRVERSADSSHDRGIYEIGMAGDSIEILPTFDLVLDVEKGDPRTAEIRVLLDAGTESQNTHNERLKKQLDDIGHSHTTLLDHRRTLLRREFTHSLLTARHELWLVQFDAYEAQPRAHASGSGQLLLYDLSRFIEDIPKLRRELAFPAWEKGRAPVYGLPYFLNPSFLVIRSDFAKFLSDGSETWKAIAAGAGAYSWQDLMAAARAFQHRHPGSILFDYAEETLETLNCLFLEVLFSLPKDQGGIGPPAPTMRLADVSRDCIRTATAMLDELLRERESLRPPQSSESQRVVHPDAIISRHWYTTYRQNLPAMSKETGGGRPIRLPGDLWTNGDWHFGILEGSVGPRKGLEIIRDQFVNESTAVNLVVEGVGLPAFRRFYSDQGLSSLVDWPLSWFAPYMHGVRVIYRSRIANYWRVAPALSYQLASLTVPSGNLDAICDTLFSLVTTEAASTD